MLLAILACAAAAFLFLRGPPDAGSQPGALVVLAKWAPLILAGFALNIGVSVAAMAIGTVSGTLLGLAQMSASKSVALPCRLIVQFFRNAPWLVLLFYAILLLPYRLEIGPLSMPFPAWLKAIIGLALPVMGNVAEIVRGGVQSIPGGQWDAARALALPRLYVYCLVILPQALKRMLPPWMNLYAVLTMATTLISIVGVDDSLARTRSALIAEQRADLMMPTYGLLLALFFSYCYPIARLTRRLERRASKLDV